MSTRRSVFGVARVYIERFRCVEVVGASPRYDSVWLEALSENVNHNVGASPADPRYDVFGGKP